MKRLLLCSSLALATILPPPLQAQELITAAKAPQQAPARRPDVIFVPTPQEAVDKMLEMAEIKKGDLLYDLGCGDGRIVVTAAKKYGIRAIGVDIDPKRIAESRENVKKNNVGHLVEIRQADIFELDLKDADVVTLYLLPSLNVKLIPQLQKLKPGTRIVSHSFDMEGVEPVEAVEEPATIYKWVAPIKTKREAAGAEPGKEKKAVGR
ncbi:MAG: class I SAM-dependent methyltransferase [Verrucomicrobia bacterium]|nr:class I SAM-dependent methyltransferase [Verrucomicrobiota bacterium]